MNTPSRAAAISKADNERLRAEQDWPAIDGHRGCSESSDMLVPGRSEVPMETRFKATEGKSPESSDCRHVTSLARAKEGTGRSRMTSTEDFGRRLQSTTPAYSTQSALFCASIVLRRHFCFPFSLPHCDMILIRLGGINGIAVSKCESSSLFVCSLPAVSQRVRIFLATIEFPGTARLNNQRSQLTRSATEALERA